MSKEIREKVQGYVRELMSELNGKTMNYATCSLLEKGINEIIDTANKIASEEVKKILEISCEECKKKIKESYN